MLTDIPTNKSILQNGSMLEMKTLVCVNYEGVIDLSMQTVNDAGQPWNGPAESKITLVMFLYAIIVGSSEH